MIAEKNENIKTAYEILQRVSKSKEARMAYEARQAEIMDQLTREKTAREEGMKEGIEKGIEKGKMAIAQNAILLNLPIEQIEALTGLPIDTIKKINELKQ